ncbi:hypothetical protein [Streptococcus sp. E17BB]|uniref:hypothetical protein n=1 Tax=Streptococcus sp. E17BB TaxID=3278714 RepID=UPI00359E5AAE
MDKVFVWISILSGLIFLELFIYEFIIRRKRKVKSFSSFRIFVNWLLIITIFLSFIGYIFILSSRSNQGSKRDVNMNNLTSIVSSNNRDSNSVPSSSVIEQAEVSTESRNSEISSEASQSDSHYLNSDTFVTEKLASTEEYWVIEPQTSTVVTYTYTVAVTTEIGRHTEIIESDE